MSLLYYYITEPFRRRLPNTASFKHKYGDEKLLGNLYIKTVLKKGV